MSSPGIRSAPRTSRRDRPGSRSSHPSDPLWALGAAIAVVLTVYLAAWIGKPSESELKVPETGGGEGGARDLSIETVRRHVERLSAAESRVTGYRGSDEAFEYLIRELGAMEVAGRDVHVQEFKVAVPVVREAHLEAATSEGRVRIDLFPLWPNLARTSQTGPKGITGPLVDVGGGTDSELAGVRIRGSVVVMDWDSDGEWLSVPEFGGKAVVFRANDRATGCAARRKFLTVPADVPRYYVRKADLGRLDALLATLRLAQDGDTEPVEGAAMGGTEVTVRCRMAWEEATARNVLACVSRGDDDADAPEEDRAPIAFHAYYDSMSVVPGLAPGAEQACGAAALLELGRYFASHPERPPRPVYVLFTGAHGQALSGMTCFVRALRDHVDAADGSDGPDAGGPLIARMGKPGLLVGLDLSSHSDRLGLFCQGHFRGQGENHLRHRFSVLGQKLDEYVKELVKGSEGSEGDEGGGGGHFVDCINLTQGRGWWTYFPYRAPFESEIPAMAGFPAVTLGTIDDERRHVDTPDDRFESVDFGLLTRQIVSRPGERAGLTGIALALAFWKGPFTSSPPGNHMARLTGRAVWLDQRRDFTPSQPLAGAAVFLKTGRSDKLLVGTRGLPVEIADEDGSFEFDGLISTSGNWAFSGCLVEAYGVATDAFIRENGRACEQFLALTRSQDPDSPDGGARDVADIERDGSIIFAVDMARAGEHPWQAAIRGPTQSRNPVCFPCRAITLFGLTDPRGYLTLTDVQMLDAATQSPPFQFGRSSSDTTFGGAEENCWTVWADPSIRVRLTLGLGFQEKRLILINNTSTKDPVGEGFVLGKLRSIPSMVLQGAGDMQRLDRSRFEKLEYHGVNNPRVKGIRDEAAGYLAEATKALEALDYKRYRAASEKGWALESKAYVELLSMTNNMIQGVLFYLALLVPFAYCLERLVFASTTIRKRVIWMAAIFIASFTVLAVIHPAFRFTMTPLIVLLAFIILALAAWVVALIVGRFDGMLRERKQVATGTHEDTGNAASIAVRAVDLGIANIRRRPQRGFLTGLTIVLVTFTLLSFTSIIPTVSISRLKHRSGTPAYTGLLARDRRWALLPEPLYYSIKRTFERGGSSVVAGRAWFFSDKTGRLSQIDIARAAGTSPRRVASGEEPDATRGEGGEGPTKAGKRFTAVSLLCMEHTEPAVTGIDGKLAAGRWFRDEDDVGIILPEHVARSLGCEASDLGTEILLFGRRMPLIGIIQDKGLDEMEDLDGETLMPVDFVRQEQMAAERSTAEEQADTLEEYEHHPADQIAIIPFRMGRRLGATLRSIAVRTGEGVDPQAEAEAHARRSNQTILASDGETVTLFAALDTTDLNITGKIAVPVLLGFIMVLGTMLGSVYERRREIFVYNSVGLSPTNVASLFLAESSVYAILGACLGYLLGQVVSKVLLETGALSGLSLNYSAGTTVLVAALSMFIVLISTVYPARQAFYAAMPESTEGHRGKRGKRDTTSVPSVAGRAGADTVSTYLPFVATPSSIFGMHAYMHEFLDGLQGISVGQLAVEGLAVAVETGEEGRSVPVLAFRAWLAPFDLGISHDVMLRVAYRAERGVYQYHLTAVRFSGDQQNWHRLTPRFIRSLRKQLLMWRILSAADQQLYNERGEALFGRAGG